MGFSDRNTTEADFLLVKLAGLANTDILVKPKYRSNISALAGRCIGLSVLAMHGWTFHTLYVPFEKFRKPNTGLQVGLWF